jgi:hypothetical protein
MKKVTYSILIFLTGITYLSSCTKVYHCSCTYNNEVTLNKELGNMTSAKATDKCNAYDTTVQGQVWDCSIY